MEEKKIVRGCYIDPQTNFKFIEYDRSSYTLIDEHGMGNISLIIPNIEELEKQIKRHKRILEKLRMENNWLWNVIYVAIRERKKTNAKKAMDELEKSISEKEK